MTPNTSFHSLPKCNMAEFDLLRNQNSSIDLLENLGPKEKPLAPQFASKEGPIDPDSNRVFLKSEAVCNDAPHFRVDSDREDTQARKEKPKVGKLLHEDNSRMWKKREMDESTCPERKLAQCADSGSKKSPPQSVKKRNKSRIMYTRNVSFTERNSEKNIDNGDKTKKNKQMKLAHTETPSKSRKLDFSSRSVKTSKTDHKIKQFLQPKAAKRPKFKFNYLTKSSEKKPSKKNLKKCEKPDSNQTRLKGSKSMLGSKLLRQQKKKKVISSKVKEMPTNIQTKMILEKLKNKPVRNNSNLWTMKSSMMIDNGFMLGERKLSNRVKDTISKSLRKMELDSGFSSEQAGDVGRQASGRLLKTRIDRKSEFDFFKNDQKLNFERKKNIKYYLNGKITTRAHSQINNVNKKHKKRKPSEYNFSAQDNLCLNNLSNHQNSNRNTKSSRKIRK